jgi:midasin
MQTTLDYMDGERSRSDASSRSTTEQLMQILFIISDGQITEDREELRRLAARAKESKQVVVLIIVDNKGQAGEEAGGAVAPAAPISAALQGSAGAGGRISAAEKLRQLKAEREARLQRVERNSVVDMQIVEFKGSKVVKTAYLDNFPFPFYLIVKNLATLPEVLADAMRQWFELLNNS